MLLSFFRLSLAIRNVWPQHMNFKAFSVLYILLLVAGMPVTLLACVPYGLFGILVAVCIYGLIACRDTAPQNGFMGMIGCMLAVVTENLLANFLYILIPSPLSNQWYFFYGIDLIYTLLFYWITLLCGKLLKKVFLSGKGILRLPQTWYVIDAALLLLITIYLFDNLIPGQNGSVGRMIYNNALHISGYLLVMCCLLLAMRRSYLEQIQTEAKQKAMQDLQDYTRNLEAMYNSLLSAKMIYAHEAGIEITIDIPDKVESFLIDTVDLARILGIFLDNAIEATLETEQPQIGLNIIQNKTGVSIIISNRFENNGVMLHKLKQKGFSTKIGHQGIGLGNAQKIISSYENVLLETTMNCDYFTQYIELTDRKE